MVASDYWSNDVLAFDITVKEAIALSNALESFKLSIKDSRVDVHLAVWLCFILGMDNQLSLMVF